MENTLDSAIDNMAKEAIDQRESISIAPTWEDLLVIMMQMYANTSYEGKMEFEKECKRAGRIIDNLEPVMEAVKPVLQHGILGLPYNNEHQGDWDKLSEAVDKLAKASQIVNNK